MPRTFQMQRRTAVHISESVCKTSPVFLQEHFVLVAIQELRAERRNKLKMCSFRNTWKNRLGFCAQASARRELLCREGSCKIAGYSVGEPPERCAKCSLRNTVENAPGRNLSQVARRDSYKYFPLLSSEGDRSACSSHDDSSILSSTTPLVTHEIPRAQS